MTDNQFKQMMNLLNKSVATAQETQKVVAKLETDVTELKSDVSELKSDVSELKSDVSELKDGQKRIEKEMRQTSRAFNELAGETLRVKTRVDELEDRDFSN